MAVYDRVDKRRRALINLQNNYKKDLSICWKIKGVSKTWLIKEMLQCFIKDIQLWWTIRRLKKSGYYDRD